MFFQSAFAGSRVDYGVDKTVDYKPNDVKKSFRIIHVHRYQPISRTITLFKTADHSSLIHELCSRVVASLYNALCTLA